MPFRFAQHRISTVRMRPPARRRSCASALVLGLGALLLAGCGLKTAPRPLSTILPPAAGLQAWQRGEQLRVSWLEPPADAVRRFGGLRGFELRIEPQPGLCLDCDLPDATKRNWPADADALERGGGRVFVSLDWPTDVERLEVRVRVRFWAGDAPAGNPAKAERVRPLPVTELSWRWADGEGDAPASRRGARAVQLYWRQPREGTESAVAPDGTLRETERGFAANVYRRVAPAPWPPAPLNTEPLGARQWIVPPLQAEFPPDAVGEEFRVRLVDRFGNEGPPSPPVQIPLSGRRP